MKKLLAAMALSTLALTGCGGDDPERDPSTWTEGQQLYWIENQEEYRSAKFDNSPETYWHDGRELCWTIEENFDDYDAYMENALRIDPVFTENSTMAVDHLVAVNLHCPEYRDQHAKYW